MFVCGNAEIESYFKHRAQIEHDDLHCRVVTAHVDGDPAAAGFYSMTVRSESEDVFTGSHSVLASLRARVLKKSLLVVHLKWVAVASDFQSRGIGTLLMGRAIDDFYHVVDRTGIAALTLKPINEGVKNFYNKLGFSACENPSEPLMFLPAAAVIDVEVSLSGRTGP